MTHNIIDDSYMYISVYIGLVLMVELAQAVSLLCVVRNAISFMIKNGYNEQAIRVVTIIVQAPFSMTHMTNMTHMTVIL